MGTPGQEQSPWVWTAADYQGNAITVSITFNDSTRAISGGSVTRDPGCVYGHVYVGTGADGIPDDTPKAFAVPVGTTNLNKNRFTNNGLNTIEDVLALQITAGP